VFVGLQLVVIYVLIRPSVWHYLYFAEAVFRGVLYTVFYALIPKSFWKKKRRITSKGLGLAVGIGILLLICGFLVIVLIAYIYGSSSIFGG